MKNLFIFSWIAYMIFSSSLCFGQAELASEKGLILSYKILSKIGSRHDEYCKKSFDIYSVEGTVENNNTDQAAVITAILSFEGQSCNKIYSNDGTTGGEVVNTLFNLDIVGQTKHKSQYWVNRVVHLLPNDKMTARGHVEVVQGEQISAPNPYFTYELIPSKNDNSNQKTEQPMSIDSSVKPSVSSSQDVNFTALIVGKWTRIHLTNTSGVDDDVSEPGYYDEYRSNGVLLHWGEGTSDADAYYQWSIEGNKLNIKSIYKPAKKEILTLNNTKLVIKTYWSDEGYAVETFKKIK
nr:hypothetical protein [uncultured Chryseobacterium sp.]